MSTIKKSCPDLLDRQRQKISQKQPAIIIYGPTAVGKTDLAIELARLMNGVMINCDLGQFYEPLSIGTAKPSLDQLDIPYALFDIVSQPRPITAVEYGRLAVQALEQAGQKGQTPIIVGGSGFYCMSLLFPMNEPMHIKSAPTADRPPYSWKLLEQIDPARARAIHHNDEYRIKRALDIWYETGQLPSSVRPEYRPFGPYIFIMVTREREDLYARINQRTDQMLALSDDKTLNWIKEVQMLSPEWQQFVSQKKILGYDDVVRFVHNADYSAPAYKMLNETIAQKTRNYAKRQLTFGAMMVRTLGNLEDGPSIITINLTTTNSCDAALYIKEMIAQKKGLL
ncbi:MAG TPA: tRNA (adenosine(37)-N6)-dimethylallyltransferase MiaA [Candidatus Babeliales bacterium]|nr:tRNA (adenosine(37)-N6)-dimethylallyltransferase MiaA [Candidatus Babeliales bacterium]